MQAIRETTVVNDHMLTLRLPDSFTATRVEVIVLALAEDPAAGTAPSLRRRSPSPKLAGTRLLDDLTAPAVPVGDWGALK